MKGSTSESVDESHGSEQKDKTDAESPPTSSSRGCIGPKDRWGFLQNDEFHQYLQLSPEEVAVRREKERERTKKWVKMRKNWQRYCLTGRKHEKMKRRSRKGIPDALRGFAWYEACGANAIKQKIPDPWKIDVSVVSPVTIDDIGRDIDRTFPLHEMFYDDSGPGQESLRRILVWYAALDPDVGYCQGMGFIGALLLSYMVEEDAFYCFYAVLTRPTAPLRLLYLPRMAETQKVLHVFGELGRMHLGALWTHLEAEGIHYSMYFTEWALTAFTRGFGFDLVTRVWDVLMNEGQYKIVYRVSLALLKCFEAELLEMKFEAIMAHLRELPRHVDANKVMEVTWSIPLRSEEIVRCEQHYAQVQAEKLAAQEAKKAQQQQQNQKK